MAFVRGREIPWLPVVRFHKEIVARAEQSFFSLNARDDQAERWSSLDAFEPQDFGGAWQIAEGDLRSHPFRIALDQGQHESLYLGAACYLAWEKVADNWVAQWRPLLYREVRLRRDGGSFEIVPESGKWSLSPLFTALLDRREVQLGMSAEELADRIIEQSAAMYAREGGSGLGAVVHKVVGELAPEIREDLSRRARDQQLPVAPTSWVLFAAANTVSALTRHLMRDYERLEATLSANAEEIGGLRLLEDRPTQPSGEPPEVLPLVPLNPLQRDAVASILEGRPVTVISGPPGTGKSQVVVSLLLNAWAAGRTVLFASNNNKAVDVVRERVERFESTFPIAVRAGARAKQNIQDVLRRTLNMASGATRGSGGGRASAALARADALRQQRESVIEQLSSELPQRIAEAQRAALQGYARHREHLAAVAARRSELEAKRDEQGFVSWTHERVGAAAQATESWLARARHYRTVVQHEDAQRDELYASASGMVRARNRALEALGLDVDQIGDARWLTAGTGPERIADWLKRMQEATSGPIESLLSAIRWDAGYDRWRSAADASGWATRARRLADWLHESCADLQPLQLESERIRSALGDWKQRLDEAGIGTDIAVSPDALEQWTVLYLELRTREAGTFDWVPWSHAAHVRGALADLERRMRPGFPLAVWDRLGALDDKGRTRFAPLIDLARKWLAFREQASSFEANERSLEDAAARLRKECAALRMSEVPARFSEALWQDFAARCEGGADLADRAASAWSHRADKEAAEERLRSLAQEWTRLASGVPVWEVWRSGQGFELEVAIRAVRDDVSVETVVALRRILYSGPLANLIDRWQAAIQQHEEAERSSRQADRIPSSQDRFDAWWAERPSDAILLRKKPGDWPEAEFGVPELGAAREWCEAWLAFERQFKPSEEGEAAKELEWSVGRLVQAVSLLPPSDELSRASRLIGEVRADPTGDWPVAELAELFAAFSPDRLKATLQRVEAELEGLAFDGAKARWLERLAEDDAALRAIDQVERAIRQHGGQVPEKLYPAFREALRLVPIWITTAQAAQAIPLLPELFDVVVIDEASQCTLTNLLPLVYRARSLAVIGDENQLPAIPTIHEAEELSLARKHGIEEHLYIVGHAANDVYKAAAESLPKRRGGVLMLREHFRSHPQIIGFSNRHVYLQSLELKKNPRAEESLPVGSGVHLIPVQGAAERGGRGRSWWNRRELEEVVNQVRTLRQGESRALSLGVVTPFTAQKELLRERLDAEGLSGEVLVDTANGFQGDERDVIIFSPVVARGITLGAARWVEMPPNLINVAITRARDALFVVADIDFCAQQDGILKKLALYCRDIKLLRETSEAELELFSWLVVKGCEPKVHPRIGDLEVDFVLESPTADKLVIEVDGDQHTGTLEADKARDAYLRAQGYVVERFTAREVLETPYDVIHKILQRMRPDT